MSILDVLDKDLSNLDLVLSAYGDMFKEARDDISIDNKTLQHANMEQGSNYARFDQIRVELEMIMDLAEMKVRASKASIIKEIIEKSKLAYGERMLEKMVEDNPTYIKNYRRYLKCKEAYMKSKSIVDALSQRGFSLNNLTRIKVAAIEGTMLYD